MTLNNNYQSVPIFLLCPLKKYLSIFRLSGGQRRNTFVEVIKITDHGTEL